ncbi:MAG TPA: adenylyltransferase/cytidyltransferase family protein [Spirochaetota bacterium]|nr:adenylyltransferase/cytidyltransferase family protein [Spirochaetota bacterium]HNT10144.1 adenylyltransferase/cytidyltransferase family protein [Spirochaetota bacterium]HNV46526.1 adenylyltransferase/cytidyltransferase family protein [Spirochaetota bacterium]HPI23013.1 adenylyltransferase/cytidyltransferase family protein [Spirochaetota bacterium]HPU90148.1 adenylyltransferase/cytidyltransferase family protein [Spirochaetota bacterium]
MVHSLAAIQEIVASSRAAGTTVVLAEGCFDVLHVGHVRYLEDARRHGDLLIVSLNSDRTITELKGPGRPLVPEDERAEVIAALRCVDHVFIFDSSSSRELLAAVEPDIYAKGTDYTPEGLIEREGLHEFRGRIVIVGDEKTHESTTMVRKLQTK